MSTSSRCGRREIVGSWRAHHDVAVEAEVLLDVLAHVWVIPVDAGVGEAKVIGEALARGDGTLGHVGHAIVRVVEPDAVPVHRRRLVERVRELDRDLCALRDLQQRARVLAVEREHRERAPLERTPNDAGGEAQRVAARQADERSRPREREAVRVRGSRQVRCRVRPAASSRPEAWRSPPASAPWTTRANPRLRAHGARGGRSPRAWRRARTA